MSSFGEIAAQVIFSSRSWELFALAMDTLDEYLLALGQGLLR